MKQSIQEILIERKEQHGDFREHSEASQALKQVIRKAPRFPELNSAQVEAIEMILHKIARILCGNPNLEDHWADIAGYSELVRRTLSERSEE